MRVGPKLVWAAHTVGEGRVHSRTEAGDPDEIAQFYLDLLEAAARSACSTVGGMFSNWSRNPTCNAERRILPVPSTSGEVSPMLVDGAVSGGQIQEVTE